jgi:hypothetical protein
MKLKTSKLWVDFLLVMKLSSTAGGLCHKVQVDHLAEENTV